MHASRLPLNNDNAADKTREAIRNKTYSDDKEVNDYVGKAQKLLMDITNKVITRQDGRLIGINNKEQLDDAFKQLKYVRKDLLDIYAIKAGTEEHSLWNGFDRMLDEIDNTEKLLNILQRQPEGNNDLTNKIQNTGNFGQQVKSFLDEVRKTNDINLILGPILDKDNKVNTSWGEQQVIQRALSTQYLDPNGQFQKEHNDDEIIQELREENPEIFDSPHSYMYQNVLVDKYNEKVSKFYDKEEQETNKALSNIKIPLSQQIASSIANIGGILASPTTIVAGKGIDKIASGIKFAKNIRKAEPLVQTMFKQQDNLFDATKVIEGVSSNDLFRVKQMIKDPTNIKTQEDLNLIMGMGKKLQKNGTLKVGQNTEAMKVIDKITSLDKLPKTIKDRISILPEMFGKDYFEVAGKAYNLTGDGYLATIGKLQTQAVVNHFVNTGFNPNEEELSSLLEFMTYAGIGNHVIGEAWLKVGKSLSLLKHGYKPSTEAYRFLNKAEIVSRAMSAPAEGAVATGLQTTLMEEFRDAGKDAKTDNLIVNFINDVFLSAFIGVNGKIGAMGKGKKSADVWTKYKDIMRWEEDNSGITADALTKLEQERKSLIDKHNEVTEPVRKADNYVPEKDNGIWEEVEYNHQGYDWKTEVDENGDFTYKAITKTDQDTPWLNFHDALYKKGFPKDKLYEDIELDKLTAEEKAVIQETLLDIASKKDIRDVEGFGLDLTDLKWIKKSTTIKGAGTFEGYTEGKESILTLSDKKKDIDFLMGLDDYVGTNKSVTYHEMTHKNTMGRLQKAMAGDLGEPAQKEVTEYLEFSKLVTNNLENVDPSNLSEVELAIYNNLKPKVNFTSLENVFNELIAVRNTIDNKKLTKFLSKLTGLNSKEVTSKITLLELSKEANSKLSIKEYRNHQNTMKIQEFKNTWSSEGGGKGKLTMDEVKAFASNNFKVHNNNKNFTISNANDNLVKKYRDKSRKEILLEVNKEYGGDVTFTDVLAAKDNEIIFKYTTADGDFLNVRLIDDERLGNVTTNEQVLHNMGIAEVDLDIEKGEYVKYRDEIYIVTQDKGNRVLLYGYDATTNKDKKKIEVSKMDITKLNKSAVVVKHQQGDKLREYVVTEKGNIISLASNKKMGWANGHKFVKEITEIADNIRAERNRSKEQVSSVTGTAPIEPYTTIKGEVVNDPKQAQEKQIKASRELAESLIDDFATIDLYADREEVTIEPNNKDIDDDTMHSDDEEGNDTGLDNSEFIKLASYISNFDTYENKLNALIKLIDSTPQYKNIEDRQIQAILRKAVNNKKYTRLVFTEDRGYDENGDRNSTMNVVEDESMQSIPLSLMKAAVDIIENDTGSLSKEHPLYPFLQFTKENIYNVLAQDDFVLFEANSAESLDYGMEQLKAKGYIPFIKSGKGIAYKLPKIFQSKVNSMKLLTGYTLTRAVNRLLNESITGYESNAILSKTLENIDLIKLLNKVSNAKSDVDIFPITNDGNMNFSEYSLDGKELMLPAYIGDLLVKEMSNAKDLFHLNGTSVDTTDFFVDLMNKEKASEVKDKIDNMYPHLQSITSKVHLAYLDAMFSITNTAHNFDVTNKMINKYQNIVLGRKPKQFINDEDYLRSNGIDKENEEQYNKFKKDNNLVEIDGNLHSTDLVLDSKELTNLPPEYIGTIFDEFVNGKELGIEEANDGNIMILNDAYYDSVVNSLDDSKNSDIVKYDAYVYDKKNNNNFIIKGLGKLSGNKEIKKRLSSTVNSIIPKTSNKSSKPYKFLKYLSTLHKMKEAQEKLSTLPGFDLLDKVILIMDHNHLISDVIQKDRKPLKAEEMQSIKDLYNIAISEGIVPAERLINLPISGGHGTRVMFTNKHSSRNPKSMTIALSPGLFDIEQYIPESTREVIKELSARVRGKNISKMEALANLQEILPATYISDLKGKKPVKLTPENIEVLEDIRHEISRTDEKFIRLNFDKQTALGIIDGVIEGQENIENINLINKILNSPVNGKQSIANKLFIQYANNATSVRLDRVSNFKATPNRNLTSEVNNLAELTIEQASSTLKRVLTSEEKSKIYDNIMMDSMNYLDEFGRLKNGSNGVIVPEEYFRTYNERTRNWNKKHPEEKRKYLKFGDEVLIGKSPYQDPSVGGVPFKVVGLSKSNEVTLPTDYVLKVTGSDYDGDTFSVIGRNDFPTGELFDAFSREMAANNYHSADTSKLALLKDMVENNMELFNKDIKVTYYDTHYDKIKGSYLLTDEQIGRLYNQINSITDAVLTNNISAKINGIEYAGIENNGDIYFIRKNIMSSITDKPEFKEKYGNQVIPNEMLSSFLRQTIVDKYGKFTFDTSELLNSIFKGRIYKKGFIENKIAKSNGLEDIIFSDKREELSLDVSRIVSKSDYMMLKSIANSKNVGTVHNKLKDKFNAKYYGKSIQEYSARATKYSAIYDMLQAHHANLKLEKGFINKLEDTFSSKMESLSDKTLMDAIEETSKAMYGIHLIYNSGYESSLYSNFNDYYKIAFEHIFGSTNNDINKQRLVSVNPNKVPGEPETTYTRVDLSDKHIAVKKISPRGQKDMGPLTFDIKDETGKVIKSIPLEIRLDEIISKGEYTSKFKSFIDMYTAVMGDILNERTEGHELPKGISNYDNFVMQTHRSIINANRSEKEVVSGVVDDAKVVKPKRYSFSMDIKTKITSDIIKAFAEKAHTDIKESEPETNVTKSDLAKHLLLSKNDFTHAGYKINLLKSYDSINRFGSTGYETFIKYKPQYEMYGDMVKYYSMDINNYEIFNKLKDYHITNDIGETYSEAVRKSTHQVDIEKLESNNDLSFLNDLDLKDFSEAKMYMQSAAQTGTKDGIRVKSLDKMFKASKLKSKKELYRKYIRYIRKGLINLDEDELQDLNQNVLYPILEEAIKSNTKKIKNIDPDKKKAIAELAINSLSEIIFADNPVSLDLQKYYNKNDNSKSRNIANGIENFLLLQNTVDSIADIKDNKNKRQLFGILHSKFDDEMLTVNSNNKQYYSGDHTILSYEVNGELVEHKLTDVLGKDLRVQDVIKYLPKQYVEYILPVKLVKNISEEIFTSINFNKEALDNFKFVDTNLIGIIDMYATKTRASDPLKLGLITSVDQGRVIMQYENEGGTIQVVDFDKPSTIKNYVERLKASEPTLHSISTNDLTQNVISFMKAKAMQTIVKNKYGELHSALHSLTESLKQQHTNASDEGIRIMLTKIQETIYNNRMYYDNISNIFSLFENKDVLTGEKSRKLVYKAIEMLNKNIAPEYKTIREVVKNALRQHDSINTQDSGMLENFTNIVESMLFDPLKINLIKNDANRDSLSQLIKNVKKDIDVNDQLSYYKLFEIIKNNYPQLFEQEVKNYKDVYSEESVNKMKDIIKSIVYKLQEELKDVVIKTGKKEAYTEEESDEEMLGEDYSFTDFSPAAYVESMHHDVGSSIHKDIKIETITNQLRRELSKGDDEEEHLTTDNFISNYKKKSEFTLNQLETTLQSIYLNGEIDSDPTAHQVTLSMLSKNRISPQIATKNFNSDKIIDIAENKFNEKTGIIEDDDITNGDFLNVYAKDGKEIVNLTGHILGFNKKGDMIIMKLDQGVPYFNLVSKSNVVNVNKIEHAGFSGKQLWEKTYHRTFKKYSKSMINEIDNYLTNENKESKDIKATTEKINSRIDSDLHMKAYRALDSLQANIGEYYYAGGKYNVLYKASLAGMVVGAVLTPFDPALGVNMMMRSAYGMLGSSVGYISNWTRKIWNNNLGVLYSPLYKSNQIDKPQEIEFVSVLPSLNKKSAADYKNLYLLIDEYTQGKDLAAEAKTDINSYVWGYKKFYKAKLQYLNELKNYVNADGMYDKLQRKYDKYKMLSDKTGLEERAIEPSDLERYSVDTERKFYRDRKTKELKKRDIFSVEAVKTDIIDNKTIDEHIKDIKKTLNSNWLQQLLLQGIVTSEASSYNKVNAWTEDYIDRFIKSYGGSEGDKPFISQLLRDQLNEYLVGLSVGEYGKKTPLQLTPEGKLMMKMSYYNLSKWTDSLKVFKRKEFIDNLKKEYNKKELDANSRMLAEKILPVGNFMMLGSNELKNLTGTTIAKHIMGISKGLLQYLGGLIIGEALINSIKDNLLSKTVIRQFVETFNIESNYVDFLLSATVKLMAGLVTMSNDDDDDPEGINNYISNQSVDLANVPTDGGSYGLGAIFMNELAAHGINQTLNMYNGDEEKAEEHLLSVIKQLSSFNANAAKTQELLEIYIDSQQKQE